jgi:hypothetical protein
MKTKRNINEWGYYGEGGIKENFNAHNGQWTEINKKMFYDQMNVMPSFHESEKAFMISEPYDTYKNKFYYAGFIKIDNRYFGMIRPDFLPNKWVTEIQKQFEI